MRLAILGTRGIPARYGGFETFAEELGVRLAEAGVDVTVLCPSEAPREAERYRGVTLRYVASKVPPPFDQILWDVRCLAACRRDYEVVYLLGVAAGFAAWLPRLSGAQVWINTDGVEWKRRKWGLAGRWYLRLAEALSVASSNRVIADSEAIARYLHARYGRLAVTSTIAYGAHPLDAPPSDAPLREWGLSSGAYYLIVCRLEPENHVRELVEGYEASRAERPLVVLGSVERPTPYVRELLAHRGEKVRFIGTVFDPPRLTALRYHARAYLHGHSVGGTNPSLLEAMACENLVLAHDNPFNREVLGDAGLYFGTSAEVADQLARVERGDVDVARARSRARQIIRERYTWPIIARQYQDLLAAQVGAGAAARKEVTARGQAER